MHAEINRKGNFPHKLYEGGGFVFDFAEEGWSVCAPPLGSAEEKT